MVPVDPQTIMMASKFLLPMIQGKGGSGGGGSGGGGGVNALSPMIGTGLGLVQTISGMVKKKKANSLFPQEEDTEQRANLNDIARKRRSFKTGSAFSESLKELKDQEALTNRGILSASGGASGAAITGLGKTQKNTGDLFAKIAEEGLQEENLLDQMYTSTLDHMVDRRLGIQTAKYNQAMSDAVDLKKKGGANLMAGFHFLTGMNKGTSPSPQAPSTPSFPGLTSLGSTLGEAGDTPAAFDLSTLG